MVLVTTSISAARVVAFGYLPAAMARWMRIMRSSGGREWGRAMRFAFGFMRGHSGRAAAGASSLDRKLPHADRIDGETALPQHFTGLGPGRGLCGAEGFRANRRPIRCNMSRRRPPAPAVRSRGRKTIACPSPRATAREADEPGLAGAECLAGAAGLFRAGVDVAGPAASPGCGLRSSVAIRVSTSSRAAAYAEVAVCSSNETGLSARAVGGSVRPGAGKGSRFASELKLRAA